MTTKTLYHRLKNIHLRPWVLEPRFRMLRFAVVSALALMIVFLWVLFARFLLLRNIPAQAVYLDPTYGFAITYPSDWSLKHVSYPSMQPATSSPSLILSSADKHAYTPAIHPEIMCAHPCNDTTELANGAQLTINIYPARGYTDPEAWYIALQKLDTTAASSPVERDVTVQLNSQSYYCATSIFEQPFHQTGIPDPFYNVGDNCYTYSNGHIFNVAPSLLDKTVAGTSDYARDLSAMDHILLSLHFP